MVFGAASTLALVAVTAGCVSADQLQGQPLEGGAAAVSSGACLLNDEASFLQVSPPQVVKPSRAQAASPMEPMLAWLQEQRQGYLLRSFLAIKARFSKGGWATIIIILVFFALVMLWFLYVFLSSTADPKTVRSAQVMDRLQPPGLQVPAQGPPRSSHLSRIDSRDSRGSAPTASAASRATKQTASVASPPDATPAREDRTNIFAIPDLFDSPLDEFQQSAYGIMDAEGQKVLHVDVMRPPKDEDASGWQAEEYVALWSGDGAEELALCALGSDPKDTSGQSWVCQVYQGGSQPFGYLRKEETPRSQQVQQYSLLMQSDGRCILTLKGDLVAHHLEVRSGDHLVARVQPGNFNFGRPGEYYKAICAQDADVGMVVLALLGAERSFCHFRERVRSWSSR